MIVAGPLRPIDVTTRFQSPEPDPSAAAFCGPEGRAPHPRLQATWDGQSVCGHLRRDPARAGRNHAPSSQRRNAGSSPSRATAPRRRTRSSTTAAHARSRRFRSSRARTHDYRRHGTTSLFAALNVATGKVIGKCYRRSCCVSTKKHRFRRWNCAFPGQHTSRISAQRVRPQENCCFVLLLP